MQCQRYQLNGFRQLIYCNTRGQDLEFVPLHAANGEPCLPASHAFTGAGPTAYLHRREVPICVVRLPNRLSFSACDARFIVQAHAGHQTRAYVAQILHDACMCFHVTS